MSEAMSQTLNVGVTTTVQLELKPLYIILSNKSPYDIQISGYGIIGIAWIAAGTAEKLNGMVYNSGVLNMTPFNTANINPAGPAAILITQYLPSDPEPKGIYPVSIPFQTVNTSSTVTVANTLTNETLSSRTLIIDMGEVGNTLLIQIFNDGSFVWSVLQSGVVHQVLKGQISGNPLLLGQSGDTSELLGNLRIDGSILSAANGNSVFIANGLDTYIESASSGNIVHIGNQSDVLTIGSSGITMKQGGFIGLSGGALARLGDCAGTGSGTVSHNLGAVPDFMAITTHVNGSQTVGFDSETSTTVHVTAAAGLAWFGFLTKRS